MWCCGASLWAVVPCKSIAIFKVKITVRSQLLKNWMFHIFWTTGSKTWCDVMAQPELECCVHSFDCCLQGQGNGEGLDFHEMAVFHIFWIAKHFTTEVCFIIGLSILQKGISLCRKFELWWATSGDVRALVWCVHLEVLRLRDGQLSCAVSVV